MLQKKNVEAPSYEPVFGRLLELVPILLTGWLKSGPGSGQCGGKCIKSAAASDAFSRTSVAG